MSRAPSGNFIPARIMICFWSCGAAVCSGAARWCCPHSSRISSSSSPVRAADWNTPVLTARWNLFGYSCPPQTLAQLSDADTDLEKSFNVVPSRQVAVRPDSQIYMLLKNLARKLLMLPQERTQFGAAVFEHGILQMFVVLALRACIHAEFHTASVSRHYLMLDEVFLFIQAHLTEELTLERLEKEFFVSREHIAREFKRQTGQTVHRYIVKARLDRCCTLIEQGLPITEVYKTSGFGGYNHFFRAFKKEYGMTPKEYFHTTRQDARG